jgi:hypothetical protein
LRQPVANLLARQKTFIIATLVSTIAGTFTTGINLYDRVADKRKQHRTDHGQNERINALEQRINNAETSAKQPKKETKDLRQSLQSGGPMIQREYEQDYARMGRRFAEGDCKSTIAIWAGERKSRKTEKHG